ncbi:LamG-like jellyroll fold domain-containing protein [Portibacter lacus]|uniref:Fibronectin type-III domain-containing protein n=1 Tax=Portibacter lacus TaxID=1099794 RepID=A0AA37SQ23_9BACT|nr:LamG-like jellyroll fold domain-containing protein [Portibacter lacus]GLR17139.1 hypothetical protein GCM10007940_17540 [Portibacter lacus]
MKKLLQTLSFLVLLILAGSGLQAQDVVASYDFSGDIKDGSDFQNNLNVNGTKLTTDRFGVSRSAIQFDGIQDRATAASGDQLNTPTTTVSFWVRMKELPGQGEVYLISYGGWQQRFKVSLPAHGKAIWTTNSTDGISDMDAGDGNELVAGVWTHLAFSHDGAKDKIYMNGSLVAEKDVTGDLNSSTSPLGLGYDPTSNANIVNGNLDDLVIFGAALSDEDVMALYESQNEAPTFMDGEVAAYSFSGNSKDDSEYGNHASGTGVKFATDRFGYGKSAVYMDGTAEISAAGSEHLNSPYTTVSFWVKLDKLPENGEYFLMSNGGWQERWKISLPSHGKPVWTTNNDGGISDMDSGDGNELVAGQWTHLAMVHDGAKDIIYMNGVQVAEKEVAGTMNSTTHPLGIGYNPIDGGNWVQGAFDDVAIYNYALDAAAIEALYTDQATFQGTDTDIVADYALNGNGNDASQFNNNATAVSDITAVPNRHGWGGNAVSGAMIADGSAALQSDNTSISFWVNPTSFPESGEAFILSNGGWQDRWKISLPAHGKPVFTTKATSCCNDMDTGEPLALDTWTHLVMIHDGDTDFIYVNGQLVGEKESLGPLGKTNYPLGIGYDPIGGESFFDGAIDDLKIFNRGLSAQEVSDLYDMESTPESIDGNLVAHYTFSGNSNDVTGYENNASAALFGKDRFGKSNKAALFTGSNEVTASNSPQLNSPLTTLSFWVNPQTYPDQGEVFLVSNGGWQERFKTSLPASGKVVWTTNNTSGISDMDSGDGGELPIAEWTHVVLVHDGTNDKIYFNGNKIAEKAVEGDLNPTTSDLGIGYNSVDGGGNFLGSLDEVQIYNTALTDQEILDLFNAQSEAAEGTDSIAPCVPLDLSANVVFNNVDLSWTPATDNEGVIAYNVFLDSILTEVTAETSISFNALTPLTDYVFGVSAIDAAGNESGISSLMVTTLEDETPDTIAPTAPMNLMASPSFNSVLLNWEAATDDTKVNGYIVYLDGEYNDSLSANNLSILVGGLDPSELYSFEVGAFDLAGNLSELAEITISTTEPLETAEPGLVAHYPFNNNAEDETPYANHGAIGGDPIFEEATHPLGGTNIKFDGDQDSILVPNGVQLLSDYTSISMWIRVDSVNLDDAESYILDFGHWDERMKISLPQHLKVVLTTNSNNTQFDNFISDMDSGDGNELVKGFWWHVTFVHDGENDIIYVNGVEANKKPLDGLLNTTARPLAMGNNPIEGGQYFNGGLDEVKIYNRALTAEEVSKLYTNGTVGVNDNVVLQKYVKDIFPNPATTKLTVVHELPYKQDAVVNVYDVSGRQVSRTLIPRSTVANGSFDIDVIDFNAGIYFLNINYGGKNLGSIQFVKL